MDSEHWFAPMANNTPKGGNDYQELYLSTGSTIPVNVTIYSGNKIVGTVTIKNGEPKTFHNFPRNQVIVENTKEIMTVLSKGLYVKGDGNFYANLRVSIPDEAEIVTSKGRTALGESFYLGMLKGRFRYTNYFASIIATQDNTTITLSNYRTELRFTNDSSPGSTTKSVKLNKGESYIYEIDNKTFKNSDYDGLIGAQIKSDKPVSVTCGNFLGSRNMGRDYFTDIFMDQILPVEKIGSEYIVMSGFGDIANSTVMEHTLVVASEDNTSVFLNNNTTSTPDFILPKAGSFQFVDAAKYIAVDAPNNIYSLAIKTSKPAYVYQVFAGDAYEDLSTGSMNIVPSLSCLLSSKINEISTVDQHGINPNTVKLNIVTQKGANLLVNNSQANISGPYPVLGNNDWEMYTYPNATGNINIATTNKKSVIASVSAGNLVSGYGGFFGGFDKDPYITSIGLCDDFKYLEVQDNYDEYEWYYSDDLVTWVLLPDKGHQLDPQRKYGYYKCKVTKHFCSVYLFTDVFLYDKCTVIGPPKEFTLSFCEKLVPPITPQFSKFPTLPVDPSKTKIKVMPEEGIVTIDNNGNINFDANNTLLNKVTFTYYFEAFGKFADSEEVTVTININQIKVKNIEIYKCVDKEGFAIYDLTEFETENNDPAVTKFQYYTDKNLTTEINPAEIIAYKTKANTTVYVKASNSVGCYRVGEIQLKTYTPPQINVNVDRRTATIIVDGGLPPYQYAIENSQGFTSYQNSNIFTNLPIGLNTVYVLSSDQCTLATQDFLTSHLSNVVTPNGDGVNDYFDFSDMSTKNNYTIKVFDRFGRIVFKSSKNDYTWDAKIDGKPLSTGTYWYNLTWEEPKNQQTYQVNSFILIKSR